MISPSTTSDSKSTQPKHGTNKPRLKRTLKRKPKFKPFEQEDMRYLWAAYKQGAFEAPEGLSPAEFQYHMSDYMLGNYHSAWLIGNIGVVFGVQIGPRMTIGDAQWFPWASKRQIAEHFIGFLNDLRKTTNYVGECTMEDKRFFDYAAKHGILRRAGTLYNPERVAVFESIRWET